MNLRKLAVVALTGLASLALADPLEFKSAAFANNTSVRNSWLSAMSITAPSFARIFDDLPNGDISGVANIYPGFTMTASANGAIVTDSASLLGASNPIGTKAVALREGRTVTLNFATPVDYFSLISIDAGGLTITPNYVGGGTSSHTTGSSASSGNTGIFFGLFRNDRPQIASVTLFGTGGDGEWGLDNIEYGVVPEPGSLLALGAGALVLARRRRR